MTTPRGTIPNSERSERVNPQSKMALIELGGIGTIRLRPRRIDGIDCWLATAVTGLQCAGGIPLALPDALVRDGRIEWGDRVTLKGRVRFAQDVGLDDTAFSVRRARPLVVLVDEMEGLPAKGRSEKRIVITPVVLFGDEHGRGHRTRQWGGDVGYTFVQCLAGSDDELDVASDWTATYATKHGGHVITNFDEQRPSLADAPLSYQRLVKKTYDRAVPARSAFANIQLVSLMPH